MPGIGSAIAARRYVVRPGDTLWGIARRFRAIGGWRAIAIQNGVINPRQLRVGKVLYFHVRP